MVYINLVESHLRYLQVFSACVVQWQPSCFLFDTLASLVQAVVDDLGLVALPPDFWLLIPAHEESEYKESSCKVIPCSHASFPGYTSQRVALRKLS